MNTMAQSLTARSITSGSVLLRMIVYPGEVYRLPEAGQRLQVQAGCRQTVDFARINDHPQQNRTGGNA
ncbi:MAG: hypothetical protein KA764_15370, partial [Anaerolineales bacterium]|nr:hypothetical protein [Anaerolineales bacterium]